MVEGSNGAGMTSLRGGQGLEGMWRCWLVVLLLWQCESGYGDSNEHWSLLESAWERFGSLFHAYPMDLVQEQVANSFSSPSVHLELYRQC